ncbi:V0/A0 complex, 116-kDa subunit of ATPase [Basidiobolus meristosporus CBS 931.73]|uniref:V-type proton ATPase subunit a n=1 Tax=Basidiobolus meristosporus CBS 931.73 TaxID=1314790 RepID=A0A1Y1Y2J1_9FUNG|nr:V0/A0 complex, 116-kDa subunit of ATPase [Basidiobolus meristosporus CBS 931.73]|eukprot:ORX91936.1 V0/A0 complex, 116-kDa subunit of ATPase [Basidiobolus meristosporus CBS 931.73]
MSLVQLFIPTEVARPTVSHLGELGVIQFRDLNSDTTAFQRAFVNEIRRLDDIERNIFSLIKQSEKLLIKPRAYPIQEYFSRPQTTREIDELEEKVNQYEQRLAQMNSSYESLQKRLMEMTEIKHILQQATTFFREAEAHQEEISRSSFDDSAPLLQDLEVAAPEGATHVNIGFIAGVIPRHRIHIFERVLWRALRGNLYMHWGEIEDAIIDPETQEHIDKNVFIIFAHGQEILAKIKKVSESMNATLYPIEENVEDRRAHAMDVANKIEDLNNVLYNINQTRRTELVAASDSLMSWLTIIKKEKAIYDVMNRFIYDSNRKCLIAEGWCPTNEIDRIQFVIRSDSAQSGSNISSILTELHTTKEPPTFHRTNKFTEGFQSIVDSYGVAKYKEVNPGLFTIITFPFLFAVMFGDFGHGLIMTAFALWMCINERKLQKAGGGEIFAMMFSGRYIILLMGFFSIFTGLIYNDMFSKSLVLFRSGWEFSKPAPDGQSFEATKVGVYPFGLDPAWHGSDNYLIFTNSYKMKMSVIFGVIQMTFGIVLTVFNYKYFKKEFSIWAEFLPQVLFMECIFGYLVITILYKWSVDWYATDSHGAPLYNSPPGLLNMLIYMFLNPGYVDPKDQLFAGQGIFQAFLLLVAFVCVPWMLCAKPYILKREHDKIIDAGYTTVGTHNHDSESYDGPLNDESESHDDFDFGDIVIHQVIHTIEFCLGCISNTASYLRLWALSLAHAQLSEVLWSMTLELCFTLNPSLLPLGIFIGFGVWFTLTVSILLIMEGLSAFLHALRLHWVEFNNKFYEGTGTLFEPFSFKSVLDGDRE